VERRTRSFVQLIKAQLEFAGSSTEPNFADRESFHYKSAAERCFTTTKGTKDHQGRNPKISFVDLRAFVPNDF